MIVARDSTAGTIGGGQLEYQCTRIACEMLGGNRSPALRKFPLGTAMGQCCGGVVDILFEPIADRLPGWLRDLRALHGQRTPAVVVTSLDGGTEKFVVTADSSYGAPEGDDVGRIIERARAGLDAVRTAHRRDEWFFEVVVGSNFNIAVFGAGHVGSAVVQTLSGLDCNIRWIDNRRNIFRHAPGNVRAIESSDPALEVAAMPPKSCYLVMTHSHALDLDICDRILRRGDAAYCGLIGSMSKRRRFEKRFRALGLAEDAIGKLVCPIGVEGIHGKKPAEIAVAAAADVLRNYERVVRGTVVPLPLNVHPLSGRRKAH
jgi:xanthine dehydrogenase accessory factor